MVSQVGLLFMRKKVYWDLILDLLLLLLVKPPEDP